MNTHNGHFNLLARVLHGDARYRDVLTRGGGAPPDGPARGR